MRFGVDINFHAPNIFRASSNLMAEDKQAFQAQNERYVVLHLINPIIVKGLCLYCTTEPRRRAKDQNQHAAQESHRSRGVHLQQEVSVPLDDPMTPCSREREMDEVNKQADTPIEKERESSRVQVQLSIDDWRKCQANGRRRLGYQVLGQGKF